MTDKERIQILKELCLRTIRCDMRCKDRSDWPAPPVGQAHYEDCSITERDRIFADIDSEENEATP